MVVSIDKPYHLLIADDDPGFRATLRTVFARGPALRTYEVASGEQALELAETERIDIALLDMNMHQLTGLETLRLLKSIHVHVPCILITADASEDLRRDASAADAYTVLGKPVRKSELVTTVSSAIRETYDDADLATDLLCGLN